MKKIFIITSVKNESDIIESFCRYNLIYSDGMIIYENNKSSDNTREIISKLIDEGLPIYFEDEEDMFYEDAKKVLVKLAFEKYSADLVIPLDADEFLYHTEGINPRGLLENVDKKIEYQALWRTYLYNKEPDIELGFLPNNFTHYRNPKMEDPQIYHRHKKTIFSRYLFNEKKAMISHGGHFLVYPEKYKNDLNIEISDKLVFAHFPIRSSFQVMCKVIPNWINKWNNFYYRSRRVELDSFQLGVLFNEIKKTGDVKPELIKKYSLEYTMLLDADTEGNIRYISRAELDKIIIDLGENLEINGKMDISFCGKKLNLKYTNYNNDEKTLIKAILEMVDYTVTGLAAETLNINEINQHNHDLSQHIKELSLQISDITTSRSWKLSSKLSKIYKFFIPHIK